MKYPDLVLAGLHICFIILAAIFMFICTFFAAIVEAICYELELWRRRRRVRYTDKPIENGARIVAHKKETA